MCVIRIKCQLLRVMCEWIWYQQMESDWECGCPQPVVPASGAGEVPVSAAEAETACVPNTCYWEGLVWVRRVRGSAAAARVGQQVTAPVPDAGCWGWWVPVTSRKWACLSRSLANFKLDLPVSRSCWLQAGISGRQESVLLSRATCECGVSAGRAWVRSACGMSMGARRLQEASSRTSQQVGGPWGGQECWDLGRGTGQTEGPWMCMCLCIQRVSCVCLH